MLSILFLIAVFWVCGKLLWWGLKAAWGITKVVATVVFFPIIVIGLLMAGLVYLAVPILVVVGIIAMVRALAHS